ncbi:ppfA [Salmonella enterica]|nr:ppfA [Salmonella enterica]EGZ4386381.1 ppfA [Salmonella enterica subsp. enterica serovar Javiana]EIN5205133.1 ppfA [Salmonella enterica subsp. enterica serovar Muenchen]ELP2131392.1 ppfA [Salmonella enterica subsp. enterica serovar Miami]EAY2181254.1 ppfA [Salmonella enterica]
MSIFSTLKEALSLKEKLVVGAGAALVIGIVIAGVVWEHRQLIQATENLGRLDQVIRERDATIRIQNTAINALNDAQKAFQVQEAKDDEEQAKYADKQEERKEEVRKQLHAAGTSRQRIPADTQRLLRQSISEFNADAGRG